MPGSTRTVARTLAAILQDAQLIREEDIEAALVRQRETGLRIGETLVELGVVTEEDIGWALAKQFGLPFVDVPTEALDGDLIREFPEGLLFSLEAVPLVRAGRSLSVAVADPTDGAVLEALEEAAGCPVQASVATRSAVRDALTAVLGSPKETHPRSGPATGQRFDVEWDRSGATFLLFHVTRALDEGARSIHFVTGRDACRVSYRIGEQTLEVTPEPVAAMDVLLARLATLGGPTLAGEDLHVTGHALCPRGNHDILLEISLLRHDMGVSAALGLGCWSEHPLALEALGLRGVDLARIRAALDLPAGLMLVCGPPRSGRSTTLGAFALAAGGERAIAFEGRTGGRVSEATLVTLDPSRGRRHWSEIAVAHDADTVVLDDVLAGDSIEQALDGAGSGRRVFAASDWSDTSALLDWLASRPARRSALAARLHLVVQQRLVAPAAIRLGELVPRIPVFEVLHVTEPMRELLREGAPAARLHELALADGLQPLAGQLDRLLAAGTITEPERHRARE